MVPGKLGLSETNVKVLVGKTLALGFFEAGVSETRGLSAADREHVRGNGHADGRSESVQTETADREPSPGVEQVAGVVADIGQLKPRHGAVVGAFELPFVFEGQRCGGIFCQAGWQGDSNGRILGDPLGRQWLILFVEHLGDAQVVVQFEDRDAQILQRRELHLGPGRDRVEMRGEFGLNLVVVYAQAGLLRSPGRNRKQNHQQSQGTREDAQ